MRQDAVRAILPLVAILGAGCGARSHDICEDIDGDGWGVGGACLGDDCDEGNPLRHEGCASNCLASPEDVGCPCAGGAIACYEGAPATLDVGPCRSGLRTCSLGTWGSCDGQSLPRPEASLGDNGVDDDCDGLVDDRCGTDDGELSPHPIGAPIGCDFECNDPLAPDFRITSLEIHAPAALDHVLIASVMQDALDHLGTVVLLDSTRAGRVSIGAGRCETERSWACGFDPDTQEPSSMTWDYRAADGTFELLDGEPLELRLPPGEITLSIPIREPSLTGSTSASANCVGSRTNDIYPSTWSPGAALQGKIAVADARSRSFVAGTTEMSLCDFLAGPIETGYCDANPDPASWDNPPDTEVGGEPAWTFAADFAAIGVLIED